ncbi:hypothetical protein [Nocardioides plantarum]|uniref:Lipoprotein n=1 Tax=Nocardioides plantarum TaxID=29299 RepID=A0ABV5KBA5_9ACTN|nr:hypothetical protein [Nocardioides plantarum]
MLVRRSVLSALSVLLVPVVAASTLTGCGGEGSSADRDGRPALTASSGAGVAEALTDLDTGRTSATIEVDGTTITRTGSYRVSGPASASEITYDLAGDDTLVTRYLSIDGVSFSQVDNGDEMQMDRCWLRDEASVVDIAPEIGVLLDLRDERGRVTTDLYTAAHMLSAQFLTLLGVTADSTARTPIDLHVDDDGTVTGWSTTIQRLAESARQAGLDPPADALALDDSTIDVRLDGLGRQVDISAPADDRQLPLDPTDPDAVDEGEFEAALQACEAG